MTNIYLSIYLFRSVPNLNIHKFLLFFRKSSIAVIEDTFSPQYGQQEARERRRSYAMHGDRRDSRLSKKVSVAGGTAPSVLRAENEHSIS